MSLTLIGITPSADVFFSEDQGVVRAHWRVRRGEPLIVSRSHAERALNEAGARVVNLEVSDWVELEQRAEELVARVPTEADSLPIGPLTARTGPCLIREWLKDPIRAADAHVLLRRLLDSPVVRADFDLLIELLDLQSLSEYRPAATAPNGPSSRLQVTLSFYDLGEAA